MSFLRLLAPSVGIRTPSQRVRELTTEDRRPEMDGSMSPVDELLALLLEDTRNVAGRMATSGYSEDEIRAAWDKGRRLGFTQETGLGQDRLTEAGRNQGAPSSDEVIARSHPAGKCHPDVTRTGTQNELAVSVNSGTPIITRDSCVSEDRTQPQVHAIHGKRSSNWRRDQARS